MSFEFQVTDARLFKALVAAVGEFADEAIVGIHPEAVKLAVMSINKVVAIHFQLPKATFEHYSVESSDPILVPLSFEYLQKIFDTVQEEPVVFRNGEAALTVYFPGPPERRFTIPLVDFEGIEIPQSHLNIELPYHCTIEAEPFQRLVKTLVKVGSVIKFQRQEPDTLLLSTHGDGVSKAEVTLRSDQEPLVEALTGPAGGMLAEYTLKWLGDIMKHVAKLGENVTLAFGDKLPLALNVVLENGGELGYFLAPRVEEA